MFEGDMDNYVNKDRLGRMLRLIPREIHGFVSYGELFGGLKAAGVEPKEVESVFKVSPSDNAYNLICTYDDTYQRLLKQHILDIGNGRDMFMMQSTQNIVSVKVHWLPVHYDRTLLVEIFSAYGRVLKVDMLKSTHDNYSVYNGVREVVLLSTTKQKQSIPHLIQFKSGHSILVTMADRPPFCLRCRCTGHIRRRCPESRRNVKPAVTSEVDPTPVRAPGTPNDQSTEAAASKDKAIAPSKEKGAPKEVASEGEQPPILSMPVIVDAMDVEGQKTPKRGSDSSWTSPRSTTGKVSRPGPWGEPVPYTK